MARIYNSRIMLDPSVLQNMNTVNQQRYENEVARRNAVMSPIRDLINSAGKTFDNYVAEKQRANEVANWSETDPIANAAKEEYIRTGNSNPMMSYQMQKLAAEAKKRADEKAEAEKKYQKELHDAVTLREDRNKYGQLQANMFKAMDEGNMADAQTYKNQMEGLEQHYAKYYPDYKNPFGDTAENMWNARSEQKKIADEKAAEAIRLERMGNNIEKEFADNSYNQRIWFETNVIPTLKNVTDKAEAKEQVERIANNLTDEDRKALHSKIDATETLDEKKKKAVEGTVANKTGEATGKSIDETNNRNTAKQYNGKKMNSLAWNKLSDDVKKYLNRDANGMVSYKE